MSENNKKNETVEMFVGGLLQDPSTQAPIVVLQDEKNQFCLPIWIGMAEATSIVTILKGIKLARPMTHDLMFEALSQTGMTVQKVLIHDLQEATYFSEIVLSQGDNIIILDSRPSDAIALALRAHAPILVSADVLEKAKVSGLPTLPAGVKPANLLEAPQGSDSKEGESGDSDNQDFNAVDKKKWAEILASLDPDDFKYKM
jgi:bifunctional DNase/RNase